MKALIIGHRGGAGEGPQNTMTAFERALRARADGIECDVHLSGDGILVVHHDPEIAPAPGADPVPIAELTAAEIRGADLLWTHGEEFEGQQVPLLDEVIEVANAAPDAWLMVEMKRGPDDVALGDAVARRLAKVGRLERLIAASFSKRALAAVAARAPDLARTRRTPRTSRWARSAAPTPPGQEPAPRLPAPVPPWAVTPHPRRASRV